LRDVAQRRRALVAARAGQGIEAPPRLSVAASDHLNAEVWHAGQVPGTSLSA